MYGGVDLCDGAAIAQVKGGVGMDKQAAGGEGHSGELRKPCKVLAGQLSQVFAVAAIVFPAGDKAATQTGRTPAKAVCGQHHQFVVAQQAGYLPTGLLRLGLEAHNQVEDRNAVRAAIDEVADKPEDCAPAGPGVVLIDQVCIAQQLDEFFHLPVDIADDRSWWC